MIKEIDCSTAVTLRNDVEYAFEHIEYIEERMSLLKEDMLINDNECKSA